MCILDAPFVGRVWLLTSLLREGCGGKRLEGEREWGETSSQAALLFYSSGLLRNQPGPCWLWLHSLGCHNVWYTEEPDRRVILLTDRKRACQEWGGQPHRDRMMEQWTKERVGERWTQRQNGWRAKNRDREWRNHSKKTGEIKKGERTSEKKSVCLVKSGWAIPWSPTS